MFHISNSPAINPWDGNNNALRMSAWERLRLKNGLLFFAIGNSTALFPARGDYSVHRESFYSGVRRWAMARCGSATRTIIWTRGKRDFTIIRRFTSANPTLVSLNNHIKYTTVVRLILLDQRQSAYLSRILWSANFSFVVSTQAHKILSGGVQEF